ncbi:hypothetical protein OHA21_11020 [Actinoplanes sp. NBC_00393]|uniref:hypothetical protein n=1 Tax=Actinoplanes sp. NBC_00393 TaxID=2975953 RepID=UPI002E2115BD
MKDRPDLLWRDFFPDEVVAALEALLSVAGPGGPWHQGWTNETDAAEARDTIAALTQVLTRVDDGSEPAGFGRG